MVKQKYVLPIGALISANILWGLSVSIIKIGQESLPVLAFIVIRFFLAAMVLLPFAVRVWRPITFKQFLRMAAAAMLDITFSVAAANYGLTMTAASNAGIIWLLMPIVMLVLSVAFLKEKLQVKSLLGIAVALAGALIVVGAPWESGGTNPLAGNLLIVLAICLNAASFIIIKPLTKVMHHYQIAFMNYFIGILPVMVYASTQTNGWNLGETTGRSWAALAAAIGISVLSNPLFYYGLRAKAVQYVGVYQYIDPLAAVIGAWFLLAERPGPLFYAGALLIAAGVYIVEKRTRLTA